MNSPLQVFIGMSLIHYANVILIPHRMTISMLGIDVYHLASACLIPCYFTNIRESAWPRSVPGNLLCAITHML